jgi:hypothetical protein
MNPVKSSMRRSNSGVRGPVHPRDQGPAEDPTAEVGGEQAGKSAAKREQRALGQQLAQQPAPPRAQRQPHRDLPSAGERPGQQQIGHVGAGDEQDDRRDAGEPEGNSRVLSGLGTTIEEHRSELGPGLGNSLRAHRGVCDARLFWNATVRSASAASGETPTRRRASISSQEMLWVAKYRSPNASNAPEVIGMNASTARSDVPVNPGELPR